VELAFRALADSTRRAVLDELFRRDGQPLNVLSEQFSMTRIGVAKHLQLLEANGLVVTKRRGREKLHFLNPLPIRLIHDRWIDKFTQGWAAGLADLKHGLERTKAKVFEIYIRTTPEQLWHAITDSETRSKYQFGALIQCDWSPGSRFEMSAGRHDVEFQLREGANDQLYGGWPMILSGLKTWLETGGLLTTPGSLMYASIPATEG